MDTNQKKLNTALFLVYCALMLWLLFDRRGPIEGVEYWEQVAMSVNLRPLHTVLKYARLLDSSRPILVKLAVVNLFGNVIMFIPLGYFLPLLFLKIRKLWKTLLTTALVIILVELIQVFTLVGSCDIDDLILNLLGAAMGYGLYRLVLK